MTSIRVLPKHAKTAVNSAVGRAVISAATHAVSSQPVGKIALGAARGAVFGALTGMSDGPHASIAVKQASQLHENTPTVHVRESVSGIVVFAAGVVFGVALTVVAHFFMT